MASVLTLACPENLNGYDQQATNTSDLQADFLENQMSNFPSDANSMPSGANHYHNSSSQVIKQNHQSFAENPNFLHQVG